MSVRSIPVESWASFFDSFSRQHHGWLVTIDTGSGRVAEEEPLEEVRAEAGTIELRAGTTRYRLPATVVTVTTAADDDSAIDHLEIASGSERLTLRFRAVINPELVDGVVP